MSEARESPKLTAALAFALAASVFACTGFLSTPTESTRGNAANGSGNGVNGSGAGASGGTSSTGEQCTSTSDTSASVLRRLSKAEYQLTLQELFRLGDAPDVSQVPEDGDQEGFRTIASLQNVSDQHLRAYIDTATKLAQELLADGTRRPLVLGCEPTDAGCLESFVSSFGNLAYRRPLESAEVTDLVTRAQASGADALDQFQYVFESLLASPSFLFRVEIGNNDAVATLSPLEVASRLSFTLWGRTPSEELLARAEAGELDSDDGLAAVASEMLADPRAQAFYRAFFKQWLNFEELRVPTKPPAGWSDALLADMIGESERLLDDFAWAPGTSLLDSLTANYTYVTPALATFYGLSASGSGFVRVDFPAGHARENTGLLTHAALISSKSDADLLAMRGKWLRNSFLCEKLEVPADLLDEIQTEVAGLSYLEVIQKRNTLGTCSGCHALIDPIGVGFVQYDSLGTYDASVMPADFGLTPRFNALAEGQESFDFQSLAELSAALEKMPALGSCIAEKAFVYTQGRFPEDVDRCALDAVAQRFAADGFSFGSLLAGLIESPTFRLRRAPTP